VGKLEKKIQIIQDWFQKKTAGQKRQFVLICTAVFVFLLVLSVLLSLNNSNNENFPNESQRAGHIQGAQMPRIIIPAEELFLPDEPDFVPGVLLGREQRSSWTEEDAVEFWQDPLRYGEEQWRVKIETAINEFLERVQ
jgi:hypothetical protein